MSLLRRLALGLALAGAAGSVCLVPHVAAAEPAPAKLEDAAKSFEAGAKAFKEKRFDEAALQFELADAAVPSAKALRLAIRSRKEAGQPSRAATLAGLALERYPDDPDTKKLATDVIGELGPKLHRLDVSCASPCILALGSRVAHGPASTRWSVFADPGTVMVSASFFGKVSGGEQKVDATEGGSSSIRFEPQGGAAAPGPVEPTPGPTEPGPTEPGPTEPTPPEEGSASTDAASGSGLSPAIFFVGAGVTAVLAGVTVWSGVDTQSNPGPDAVRAACVGQGTECPAYQDGQAAEMRTNVLIGATAGVGVVTLAIGAFFTDWGGADAPADASQARGPSLWVGAGGARVPLAGRAHHEVAPVAPRVVGDVGDLALRVGGSF